MELRLKTARTTRDIDLAIRRLPVASADRGDNVSDVLESLREAGNLDLHDFFTFVSSEAMQDLDAAPYGGARFPVDARLAGRTLAKFHRRWPHFPLTTSPHRKRAGRVPGAFFPLPAGEGTAVLRLVFANDRSANAVVCGKY